MSVLERPHSVPFLSFFLFYSMEGGTCALYILCIYENSYIL